VSFQSRAGADAAHLSREGQVLGTPLYMAPEQATGGRDLDGRGDLYSLGAVAYYLLTGRPPFEGEDGIGVMIAHARDPVVPPSRGRADVPEDLERVVLRCLAKDPAERFPDAVGLEHALGGCACAADWDRDRPRGGGKTPTRATASRAGRGGGLRAIADHEPTHKGLGTGIETIQMNFCDPWKASDNCGARRDVRLESSWIA
jgi:serine/threonine protein kinase